MRDASKKESVQFIKNIRLEMRRTMETDLILAGISYYLKPRGLSRQQATEIVVAVLGEEQIGGTWQKRAESKAIFV